MLKPAILSLGLVFSSTVFGQNTLVVPHQSPALNQADIVKKYYVKQPTSIDKLFVSLVQHNLEFFSHQLPIYDFNILEEERLNLRQQRALALQQVNKLVIKEADKRTNSKSKTDAVNSLVMIKRIQALDEKFNREQAKRILARLSEPTQQFIHGELLPEIEKANHSYKLDWQRLAKEQPQIYKSMQNQMFEHVDRLKVTGDSKVVYYEEKDTSSSKSQNSDGLTIRQGGYKIVETTKGEEQ